METCEHLVDGVLLAHPACGPCPTQEELHRQAQWFLGIIEYRKVHPKRPGEEGYEFWKHYQGDQAGSS